MGVGNFPATDERLNDPGTKEKNDNTFRKTRTQKTRNLLDQSFRSKESVVLLGELLHKLLVLIQSVPRMRTRLDEILEIYGLFEIVDRHVLKLNLLGTIDISRVCKNADGHARSGDIREPV
jgi:hypothetical protein